MSESSDKNGDAEDSNDSLHDFVRIQVVNDEHRRFDDEDSLEILLQDDILIETEEDSYMFEASYNGISKVQLKERARYILAALYGAIPECILQTKLYRSMKKTLLPSRAMYRTSQSFNKKDTKL